MRSTWAADRSRRARRTAPLGRHHLVDFLGCPRSRLATVEAVEGPFLEAVRASGARVLGHASRQFRPAGATVVVMLAESHASIHTWPEHAAACMDFFTCSPAMDASATVRLVARALRARTVVARALDRGAPR